MSGSRDRGRAAVAFRGPSASDTNWSAPQQRRRSFGSRLGFEPGQHRDWRSIGSGNVPAAYFRSRSAHIAPNLITAYVELYIERIAGSELNIERNVMVPLGDTVAAFEVFEIKVFPPDKDSSPLRH